MKKVFLLLTVISGLFFTSCDKETVLAGNDVPSEIQAYVSTHFPENSILQTVKDKDGSRISYDVVLQDNIKLEFNKGFSVTSIESYKQLPNSVIPEKILAYVTANYANNYIIEWELDNNRQKVELNNQLELEFSKDGDFIRID